MIGGAVVLFSTMNVLSEKKIWKDLKLHEFVALDIETTGLDFQSEAILEVAAVRYENGLPVDELNFYVNPQRAIPEYITRITGITEDDVRDAEPFSAHLDNIREFIGQSPIVGHNVGFDLNFLEQHARITKGKFKGWDRQQREFHYFPNPTIDTLLLTRVFMPFLNSFSLQALVQHFNVDSGESHRALPDARASAAIFEQILYVALESRFHDLQQIMKILEPVDENTRFFFEALTIFAASGKYSTPEGINKETFSIKANHYNIIGDSPGPKSSEGQTAMISTEEIVNFFEEDGALASQFGLYEKREAQIDMAAAIARAFNQGELLVAEAGTGTGKSMAYLLPAIKWAMRNESADGRVIVSTNTKNLQEQLFFKDLPILHSILKDNFKAVLLKGKGNYLCLDKWVRVLQDMKYLLTPDERLKILPLFFWVQQTETGDIAENNGFRAERNRSLWSKMIAENNYCPGKTCKYYDKCFLMKARNNARDAHLVLVNHSLLFSDLAADNAVLSDYQNVVFDEAHNIEKTATDYMGVEITTWQFRDLFRKLYNKDKFETGILVQIRRRMTSGSLPEAHLNSLNRMLDELIEMVKSVAKQSQKFFRELTKALDERTPRESRRYTSRIRYSAADEIFEPVMSVHEELHAQIRKLETGLHDLEEYFMQLPADSFEYQRQMYQDLTSQSTQVDGLLTNLAFLMQANQENFVYWYELPHRQDSFDTRFYAAPLNIGDVLNERLYAHLNSAVFTSATLAVNRRFDYFMKRVGLHLAPEERVNAVLLSSPFNYEEQVLLGVPTFLPDPSHPEYLARLRDVLAKLMLRHRRGTLVLFTSYSMLNNIYKTLRPTMQAEEISLLGQGIDGSRHVIINRFKQEEGSVLLGTDSFWEGVDVPGKALELVLITKLPFDVPSDPVIKARSELIERQGGNPFMDFAIPEAVIRFRQGFGRLIRSREDYGAILVLDNRVVNKFYGRIFLQSLPAKARFLADEDEFDATLDGWLGQS